MHICTQMSISTQSNTQSHTDPPKQHASLQDQSKRFIFRPLGALLCSGFTQRLRELSCPLQACVWGVGLLLWPKAWSSSLSVGQCENGVQQSADG